MPKIIAKILDQTIGGTNIDSQGEKIPKYILERIAEDGQTVLYQNHQPEKPSIGYLNNFKIVPDPQINGEWLLKADAYFYEEPEDIKLILGGFSWSFTELLEEYKTAKNSDYAIYLPWPYYNDKSLLYELSQKYDNLALGKWYKKAADPTAISLIVGFIFFILSPAWERFFNEILWPKLSKVFGSISNLREKGIQRCDLVQIVEIEHYQVNIYFIPEVGEEDICYSKDNLKQGFEEIYRYSKNDSKSYSIGYQTIKLFWNKSLKKYELFHIEFKNGTTLEIIDGKEKRANL